MRYFKVLNVCERRRFDPSALKDLQELKFFLENNKWRNGCPFYIEDPWEEIPVMCMTRYSQYMLSKI